VGRPCQHPWWVPGHAVGRLGASTATEQAATKTLYLVIRSLDPRGLGQARWITRWKPALNAFAITFADRMPAAETL
jgi:transposase-like protein